jgi:hypothetical protein
MISIPGFNHLTVAICRVSFYFRSHGKACLWWWINQRSSGIGHGAIGKELSAQSAGDALILV